MNPELARQAAEFAEQLNTIVNGTISNHIKFNVNPIGDGSRVVIQPERFGFKDGNMIPIESDLAPGEPIWLWLKVFFQANLSSNGGYLTIQTSAFSLVIDHDTGNPALRVEFERDRGSEPTEISDRKHSRSAAHVQIHGVSEELSYIQGRHKKEMRRLEDYHFPVGGRRFRPTLEDFIEFIYIEKLVRRLHPNWREILMTTRIEWEEKQLRAAVYSNPQVAISKLNEMGYLVQKNFD